MKATIQKRNTASNNNQLDTKQKKHQTIQR